MRRILVTGGAGFIGSHLIDALVGAGHQVIVLDDLSSGKRGNLDQSARKLRLLEGDIRDISDRAVDIGEVDTIVHLAARISGHDSLVDPIQYFRVNLEGTQALIDFAGKVGVKRFLFASSSMVYGNQPAGPISEGRAPEPLTIYALSKLAAEHLLRMYSPLRGFSHCSLRLFNVYGPRQATDHPYANVTCKFSHAAAHGLTVPLFGDGEQARDFIFVTDVVTAFLHVLEGSTETIYNVGTGRAVSINSMIACLSEIGDGPLRTEAHPPWPNDIQTMRAGIDRIRREFAFDPRVQLEDGLRQTVEFFANASP